MCTVLCLKAKVGRLAGNFHYKLVDFHRQEVWSVFFLVELWGGRRISFFFLKFIFRSVALLLTQVEDVSYLESVVSETSLVWWRPRQRCTFLDYYSELYAVVLLIDLIWLMYFLWRLLQMQVWHLSFLVKTILVNWAKLIAWTCLVYEMACIVDMISMHYYVFLAMPKALLVIQQKLDCTVFTVFASGLW